MSAEHPATDALEHLRRAALELVQAARSGLDLVEDLVADPRAVSALAGELAHAALVRLSEPPDGGHGRAAGGDPAGPVDRAGPADAGGFEDPGRPRRPAVQHIPLS